MTKGSVVIPAVCLAGIQFFCRMTLPEVRSAVVRQFILSVSGKASWIPVPDNNIRG